MPLVSAPHIPIEVAVSDRVFGDTIVKQKARFLTMKHDQNALTGECSVVVKVAVVLYATTEDGQFGDKLTGNGFSPYFLDLVGDNKSLIDLTTGLIVANRGMESDEQWRMVAEAFEQPVMPQGDYFEYAREHELLSIGDLIKHHIELADQAPFSRFVNTNY